MIAMGGVGFTITGPVEVLGVHRYHPFLRPAVLWRSSATRVRSSRSWWLGRPVEMWMILISGLPPRCTKSDGAFCILSVLAFEFAGSPSRSWGGAGCCHLRDLFLMLLGVTLSHLRSSLGTLMTLIPHKKTSSGVGSAARLLSHVCHDGRAGGGDS